MDTPSHTVERAMFLVILLVGAALRLVALEQVPTADPLPIEAQYLDDPLDVLDGDIRLVFDSGERLHEPLYTYATAAVMLVAGRSLVAARLTSALFGIALLVLVYVWVRVAAESRWLALATMAGLAVSFWGVATSRVAVNLVTFPVVYMLAAIFMRRGIHVEEDVPHDFVPMRYRPRADVEGWLWFALAGLFLGLTFYTHPVAYAMWLVFPAFFVFLALTQHGVIRPVWRGLALMLIIAVILGAPIALIRVEASGQELVQGLAGTLASLREASRSVLGIIGVWGQRFAEARGPGSPLLGPVISLLYYVGVSVAALSLFFPYQPARRGRRTFQDAFRITSANMFMLLTLAAGLAPVLIDGLDWEILPIIGMQPALYYFPALAVLWLADAARRHVGRGGITALSVAYGAILLIVLGLTIDSIFAARVVGVLAR